MATPSTSTGGGFRHWRRTRPFWGGLLLLIAGLELFLSANLTLGDLQVHFGPEGFLSYLLPLLLLLCGVLTWVTPGQRLFYGILGLLTAVYSLIGLNFGGFGLGMVLGIFGGALVLAWSPARPAPAAPAPAPPSTGAEEPAELPYGAPPDSDVTATRSLAGPSPDDTAVLRSGIVPGFGSHADDQGPGPGPGPDPGPGPGSGAGAGGSVAGGSGAGGPRPAGPGASGSGPAEPPSPPAGGVHRKALVITLVPLVLSAALVTAGRTPARAEEQCPEGLPSRPAAAAKREIARQSSASASAAAARTKARTRTSPPAARKSAPPSSPSSPGKSSPAKTDEAEEGDGKSGNPIVDGLNGLVDGVGDLLGIGDDETPSASPSATPPESPGPAPSVPATTAPGSGPQDGPTGKPEPGDSGTPGTATPSGPASPSATPSLDDIPCLGPRVFKEAGPDDVPTVSLKGGTLEGKKLTMYNSTYDGVIDLPTATGTLKALKFSMTKSVTEPFKLTIPEKNGHRTIIDSNALTTEGNVRFYTPRFKGKLFGLIPVTFTPEQPPPLTLKKLWFTDVSIQLAFVRCDKLTADPLKVTEKA
ncbi:hypothetical protein Asp14428_05690 [Actinoplanes sp. NBRC 14428]|nr:hypothetical protein Asp14428_05690 [Actinoplanes sp. NBRC 14428]